jgi:Na+/H+ antiporter NhaD/arsenite permease-like protein
MTMTWEGWVVLATVFLMAFALLRNMAGPDVVLMGGLTLLMTLGLASEKFPTPAQAAANFGNEGLVTIGVLFVVAQGLSLTGAMSLLSQPLLGRPRSALTAQLRMMLPVATLSAFMNNTTVVAMFTPAVTDWCKKTGLSPSKLFIPLSYAAIMGGCCTLIGTATNLIVQGMVLDAQKDNQLLGVDIGMFTIAAVDLNQIRPGQVPQPSLLD